MSGNPPLNILNPMSSSKIELEATRVSALVLELTIEGEPASKQRARWSSKSRSFYTPSETRAAQDGIAWAIKSKYRDLTPEPHHAFAVLLHFHTKNRQRRDVDNMTKLVFDACNKVVWRDDVQVEYVTARVTRQSNRPRTEIEIYTIISDTPFVQCELCTNVFRTYPSWPHRKFCSKRCSSLGAQNGIDVDCAQCGARVHKAQHKLNKQVHFCSRACLSAYGTVDQPCAECGGSVLRPKSHAKKGRAFCCIECRSSFWRKHRAKTAVGVCPDCGGTKSDKRRARCLACSIKAKRKPRSNYGRLCSSCKEPGHYKNACKTNVPTQIGTTFTIEELENAG